MDLNFLGVIVSLKIGQIQVVYIGVSPFADGHGFLPTPFCRSKKTARPSNQVEGRIRFRNNTSETRLLKS